MADVAQGKSYPEYILHLNKDTSEENIKQTFDEWADTYEEDIGNHGYKGHMLCVEAFEKAMQSRDVFSDANKDIKILDTGAGTGIIGEMLAKRGYTNIDALDISQEMLNIAAKRNVYKRLICAALSEARIEEIQTAEYDVVLSAGTIVYGQVKAAALDECVRHVRPGGLFIFSIRVDSYDPEELGYSAKCTELENSEKWRLVHKERRELHANPDEERYRDCYLITYKVL